MLLWFRWLVRLVNEAGGDREVLAEIVVGHLQDGCATGITAGFSKSTRRVAKVVRGVDGVAVGGRVRADRGQVIVRMPYVQVSERNHVVLGGVECLQCRNEIADGSCERRSGDEAQRGPDRIVTSVQGLEGNGANPRVARAAASGECAVRVGVQKGVNPVDGQEFHVRLAGKLD